MIERQLNNQTNILSLKQHCFEGDLKYHLNLEDIDSSLVRGHLWADNFETLLRFMIPSDGKFRKIYDTLIEPISDLKFENGADF